MEAAFDAAISSVLALSIGGISAILGLWVGRDKTRPVSFAVAMTLLIGIAVVVGIVQSVLDADDAIKKQADLDRMVDTVAEIAIASGDTELAALIEAQVGRKVVVPEPVEEEAVAGDTGAVGAVAEEGSQDAADGAAVDAASPASDGAAAPDATPDAAAPADVQE